DPSQDPGAAVLNAATKGCDRGQVAGYRRGGLAVVKWSLAIEGCGVLSWRGSWLLGLGFWGGFLEWPMVYHSPHEQLVVV
ncbi:MAG TPA: hypothetical protein PKE31_19315, partial [Pseudomonadota bacterium]|nr:hypothetical protein [Pseudomonadota bacterium]